MRELNAIITIACRDLTKLLRDRIRLIASLVFPFIFIGVFGGGLSGSFAEGLGFNYLNFIFVGVLAQTMFSSTASGVIFLLEDRENDFSKEFFVAPISRYSIAVGKILGETIVSLTHGIGIMFFGIIIGVPLSIGQLSLMLPTAIASAILGGAFGLLVLSFMGTQRRANQIFPFFIFPQYFLAGVFSPTHDFTTILAFISKITPMTYAVDLMRNSYYAGLDERLRVVAHAPFADIAVLAAMSVIFILAGTYLFVRKERNR